ncbi:uncharacterized protein LOC119329983 [Triticum dicoccoides]|uniref:uncharacterized protein LOC119329983 n=1 Tax=Triticum dicoccoides TaxID=85692 RepID=UPI0003D4A476|nr:uncharacterized protein LOC119329983 [Triticum dicoccoides]XP_037458986.1 uncharacterized protein LOC119329983 [Triticum dicoccoides]XP_044424856.1 uncharacterized protein LOC123149286 isoform X1 [Triticum aestivum]
MDDVVRMYIRYTLNGKQFNPDVVLDLIRLRKASMFEDNEVAEILNQISRRIVREKVDELEEVFYEEELNPIKYILANILEEVGDATYFDKQVTADLETISTKKILGQLTFHGHAYQNQIKSRKLQSCLIHIAFQDQMRICLMWPIARYLHVIGARGTMQASRVALIML